ncbi:FUSC family protein [Oryzifoliimicrobium ureilyticus]|uniref:FUSC family protein n=1 Tax=Oryzifoliimicrobium ureilyticus TaxID=3113724 RepID=UPI003F67276F
MSWIGHFNFRDWLVANDPALTRLRLASRVTLAVVLSFLVLLGTQFLAVPLPTASYALAILLSIQGGVAVRDKGMSAQAVTRLYACLASITAVWVASLLEPHRYVSDLIFLLVAFLASAARIYGVRGHAIGMFAFLSYFMGAYFHPGLAELPLASLGCIVSSLVNHLVRAFLLADDWRRDLLVALESVNSRVNRILVKLYGLGGSDCISQEDREELLRLEERLKDAVLMAQSLVPRPDSGLFDEGKGEAAEIAIMLFDLHLAAESAIVLSQEKPPSRETVSGIFSGKLLHSASEEAAKAWSMRRLAETRNLLIRVIKEGRTNKFSHLDRATASATSEPVHLSWTNPHLQRALQITLAAALAMIFGLLLSRERWFWAVLASFLVFVNTTSRGDTAMKAIQRSLGTLLGIVAGLFLAQLTQHLLVIALPLATVCIFLAFYFLQISYATMTFFVSITLCLAYAMTGGLTLDLLLLRVEETGIGAIAGTLVAFFVFPARTRENVDQALGKWFHALRALLVGLGAKETRSSLVLYSQALDSAYRDLTAAVQPLGSSWSIVTRPGHIRQTLAILLSCTYWARLTARTYHMREEDRDTIDAIIERLDRSASQGSDCFFINRKTIEHRPQDVSLSEGGARLALEMVGTTLARLYPSS